VSDYGEQDIKRVTWAASTYTGRDSINRFKVFFIARIFGRVVKCRRCSLQCVGLFAWTRRVKREKKYIQNTDTGRSCDRSTRYQSAAYIYVVWH
jgi:hypothetical protein